MSIYYTERYAVHPADCETYNNTRLRENFHVGGLFKAGENLDYDDMDKINPADFTS